VRVDELAARFVAPFYLNVLHGNLTRLADPERTAVRDAMPAVAAGVSLDIACTLWSMEEWRCKSWRPGGRLCGVDQRPFLRLSDS
jgi:hypothetical protein